MDHQKESVWKTTYYAGDRIFDKKKSKDLKGHGNEADFLGFLHKSVRHRSLTLHFDPFDFGCEVAEIFVIEKRLSDSASWGVDKNSYRYNFFSNL
jgi:hypothetical protein